MSQLTVLLSLAEMSPHALGESLAALTTPAEMTREYRHSGRGDRVGAEQDRIQQRPGRGLEVFEKRARERVKAATTAVTTIPQMLPLFAPWVRDPAPGALFKMPEPCLEDVTHAGAIVGEYGLKLVDACSFAVSRTDFRKGQERHFPEPDDTSRSRRVRLSPDHPPKAVAA